MGTVTFEALPQPDENFPTVFVDPAKTFQTIVGIGGAFLNPGGRAAVVVLNLHDKPIDFQIWVQEKAAKSSLPAHSIATLVF
jgi:O-glycosyl hydrolase